MVIAFSLITLVVLARTAMVLLEHAPARRFVFATAGAAQLVLGVPAAGVVTLASWSAQAAEPVATTPAAPIALDTEEAFFVSADPNLPDWVAQAKSLPPESDWTAVVSDPCPTAAECETNLALRVKDAADDFINRRYGWSQAARLLNYDAHQLKSRLVSSGDTYLENRELSVGEWKLMHARVEFTPDFLKELDRKWHDIKAKMRLAQVGLIGAVVLSLLSTAFGFFKANTATRGQKGTSLQFAAAATILGIVVAGVTAAKYMYWF